MSLLFGEVRLQVPATPRELRRLVAAIALCKGEAVPVDAVPHDYLPILKAVNNARTCGRSWSDALAGIGLELPDEEAMLEQIAGLREELQSVWPQVQHVLGALQRSGNTVAVSQTVERIRALMT